MLENRVEKGLSKAVRVPDQWEWRGTMAGNLDNRCLRCRVH